MGLKWSMLILAMPLGGVNFEKATLPTANFEKADLVKANFIGANLREVNFKRANLKRADFTKANLAEVNFTGANLTQANLTGANLRGANLTRANLTEADLTGAKFDINSLCNQTVIKNTYFALRDNQFLQEDELLLSIPLSLDGFFADLKAIKNSAFKKVMWKNLLISEVKL